MSTIYVHTLGDSTLDNLYWFLDRTNLDGAKEASVEGQLHKRLNEDSPSQYEVVSHAYDGFTTASILDSDRIGRVLPNPNLTQYLTGKNINPQGARVVHPLNDLKAFVSARAEATHYVVISVLGNDFRERLINPIGMLMEIPNIHRRYLKIVEEVTSLKDKNVKPILMFQYRVDAHHDHYWI